MEQTLVILKPSCVARGLMGAVIGRLESKGLIVAGMKMMQLDEQILREHYSHLVDKPFFPSLVKSMMATPVVVMCIEGVEAVKVVRDMAGVTNGRNAAPGTIRGDFSVSGQKNIVHASDTPANAAIELARFFKPEEIFSYKRADFSFCYADDEVKE